MLQWIARLHLRSYIQKITVISGVTTVFFCLFLGFSPVHAQSVADSNSTLNQGVNVIQQPLGLAATDIRIVISRIIRVALGFLGLVVLVVILYGGYLYMTAGGNEEQISSAKKILINGTIGLAIILSAYAIVMFVARLLGVGAGGEEGLGGGVSSPDQQNFYGTGGLGGVIKDHYPERNQVNVPRNAKIVITFRKAINPASFIRNTNASKDSAGKDVFGDCLNVGASMKWEVDCDSLVKGSDLISIKQTDTGEEIEGASVLANYENGKIFTVVIRPYRPLGKETGKVGYTVRIGDGVELAEVTGNNASIFAGRPVGRDFYEWQFSTNTTLDTSGPRVQSVFPAENSTESKNSVIQIDFNEPIDPTGVQGSFTSGSGHYVISGNMVFLKTGHSTVPAGQMRLGNGYRTLEFTPSKECGQNACGGTIYCLPVCDQVGADCSQDVYQMLLRAAQTFSASSFEAIPFSGISDLSGNALDSKPYGEVNSVSSTGQVFPDQQKPDNFTWKFTLDNKVDLTAPYIKQTVPGPDAENISANQELSILFSKRMRVEPMYSINIAEEPAGGEALCKVPRLIFDGDGTTRTYLNHCPFLDKVHHYYFPIVGSEVEDVKFNCFFPGIGPVATEPASKISITCENDGNPEKCCQVNRATGDVFCCNGFTDTRDVNSCVARLRALSPVSNGP